MTAIKQNKKLKNILQFLALFLVFSITLITFKPLGIGATVVPDESSNKLAITPAGFDDMNEVLKDLDYNAVEIEEDDLSSLSTLSEYDAVYINCSSAVDIVAEDAKDAIKDYVENGGIVYASDYANSIIEAAFPEKIKFYKGYEIPGGESNEAESSRVGNFGKQTAKITDPGLESVLDKDSIEVDYNLPNWAVIDSVSSDVDVLVKGPVPVAGSMNIDAESLEEFKNMDLTDPSSTEELNEKFYDSAETLDDKPYVVTFSEGKGEVLYTTFHNEVQNTSDMEKMLDWFAIRIKAGKLTQRTRALTEENDEILQEVVDGISNEAVKAYTFKASGKADFKVTLNFGGSELSITVEDPNGEAVLFESVENPPLTESIDNATKGTYTIKVEGIDVDEENYPFIVAITGDKIAIEGGQPLDNTPTEILDEKNEINILGLTINLDDPIVWGIAGGVVLLILIIIILLIRGRRKKGKIVSDNVTPQKTTPPASKKKNATEEPKDNVIDLSDKPFKPDSETEAEVETEPEKKVKKPSSKSKPKPKKQISDDLDKELYDDNEIKLD